MSKRQSRSRYYEVIASGQDLDAVFRSAATATRLDLEAEGHLGPQRIPPHDLAAMVAKGLR